MQTAKPDPTGIIAAPVLPMTEDFDLQVKMFDAVQQRDYPGAFAIWDRLGPLARMMWGPPLRDYRQRMKEALVMLGLLRSAAVRPPLLPIDESERQAIHRLLVHAGLLAA